MFKLDISSILTVFKFRSVFERETRSFAIRLFFLNCILTCFDLAGLAAVPGYFSLIFAPDSKASKYILNSFGDPVLAEYLILLTLLLAFFFCIKFIFSVFLINYENKFVYQSTSTMSLRVANTVANTKLFQLSDSDVGEKIKLIESDASRAVLYLKNCIVLMKELFLFIIVTFSIAIYDVYVFAYSVGIVVSVLILYQIFFKNRLVTGGQESRKIRVLEIQSLQKIIILNSLLKIYNHLLKQISFYGDLVLEREKIEGRRRMFAALPKLVFEVVIVLFICSVVFFLYAKGDFDNAVTIITLFGLIGIRLVPTVNSIVYSVSEINYQKASLVAINSLLESSKTQNHNLGFKTFKSATDEQDSSVVEVNSIELNDVCFSYQETKILNSINIKGCKGQMIGIFGPSGSGKSTLLNILSGYLSPASGSIKLNDVNLAANQKIAPKFIGYVPQDSHFFPGDLDENIIFDHDADWDPAWLENVKSITGVNNLKLSNSNKNFNKEFLENVGGVDTLQRFSGGQRQRVSIARALFRRPKILLCDEITSSLDSDSRDEILRLLNKLKKDCLIFIISHDNHISQHCDKNYLLKNGKLVGYV